MNPSLNQNSRSPIPSSACKSLSIILEYDGHIKITVFESARCVCVCVCVCECVCVCVCKCDSLCIWILTSI